MIDKYYYTDKEVDKLCKSIVILVDTREQKNQHITEWFDNNKIVWKSKALKNGDYSFMVPAAPEFNIDRDLYFDQDIMIERKRNLDEIAGNFTAHRARFEEELATFPGKMYLLLENSTYGDIIKNKYRSQISVKSFIGTLHTFNHRYDLEVTYMPDIAFSGAWIYGTFIYYLKKFLR